MSNRLKMRLVRDRVMVWLPSVSLCLAFSLMPAFADTQPEIKRFASQVVSEAGCPVEVTSSSTELEMDPFGVPLAARHYIDYRNASNRPIAAVRFRIGYVANDGTIHQAYLNGDDRTHLDPGAGASQKWRGDKVDPRTSAIKIRVLKVKFDDGGVWESVKVSESNSQKQQGFAPLTTENPGEDIVAGTPVQLKDYGQQNYKGYPDRTNTGPVPFTQTPSSGAATPYSPNAFNAAGPAGASTPSPAASMPVAPADAAPALLPPMNPNGQPQETPLVPTNSPQAAATGGAWDAPSQLGGNVAPQAAAPSPMSTPAAMPASIGTPAAAPELPPMAPPAAVAPVQSVAPAVPAAAPPAVKPAVPSDPMSDIDQLIGTPKK